MNELIFLGHTGLLIFSILIAYRLGKEALSALCSVQILIANLFVLKQIDLFGFTVTSTDAYAVGSILALNLIQTTYGKEFARKILMVNFFLLFFLALMTKILLLYAPATMDTSHWACVELFSSTPRIAIASFGVYFVVNWIDIELLGYLRKRLMKRGIVLPILLSISITQLFDTCLFSLTALYGIVSSILDVMVISYFVKMCSILLMTPFTALIKRFEGRLA